MFLARVTATYQRLISSWRALSVISSPCLIFGFPLASTLPWNAKVSLSTHTRGLSAPLILWTDVNTSLPLSALVGTLWSRPAL